jgi:hypothetical protein
MGHMLTTIKTTGVANANQIVLDEALPNEEPTRVGVIVFFENGEEDIPEEEWLKFASSNEAFDFLNYPAEDIYTLEDGKPLRR